MVLGLQSVKEVFEKFSAVVMIVVMMCVANQQPKVFIKPRRRMLKPDPSVGLETFLQLRHRDGLE